MKSSTCLSRNRRPLKTSGLKAFVIVRGSGSDCGGCDGQGGRGGCRGCRRRRRSGERCGADHPTGEQQTASSIEPQTSQSQSAPKGSTGWVL